MNSQHTPRARHAGARAPRQPWYREAAPILIAAVFCLLVIGLAMLITKGQRVGFVGTEPDAGTATPTPFPGGAPPAPPKPGPAVPDAVPDAFLGSWSGTLARTGGLDAREERITVRAARIGSENTTAVAERTDPLGRSTICRFAWTLLSASTHQLTFRVREIGGSGPGGCADPPVQTLTPGPEGSITHSFTAPGAGSYAGVLGPGA